MTKATPSLEPLFVVVRKVRDGVCVVSPCEDSDEHDEEDIGERMP